MVGEPVMKPDAVKNNRESKTSVKVTLNTIISAGKEHTRHVSQIHSWWTDFDASEAIYTMSFHV